MTNNKDILFSMWYDSLEGTKSHGFAYKAWCAGWDAANQEKHYSLDAILDRVNKYKRPEITDD